MGADLAWFTAPWRRQDLHVDGVLRDDADVLWLQAGEWYADLRIPHIDAGGPVEAFAGTATWSEPHFTWHHDVDWIGSFPEDVGHLELDGDDLIERGTFSVDGRDAPYEERWVRSGPEGPALVATGEGAMLVRVADHVIAMVRRTDGGFVASRYDLVDGRWRAVFCRATSGAVPTLPALGGDLAVGDRLELGVHALTVELVRS